MSFKNKILILVILIISVTCFYYLQNMQRSTLGTSVPQTGSPIPINTGKCHAIWVDKSDSQAYLPDPDCTPGSTDPAVTQENLKTTICKSGYTKTVRPPVSYTNSLKKQQIIDYGYNDTNLRNYEEDHLISLELGGNPNDPKNLWPEPHASVNEKDLVENYLHTQVCAGNITLFQAQNEIETNWYKIYKTIH